MVTEFELVDIDGNVVGQGEISSDGVYLVFSSKFEGGVKEFEGLGEMFAACGAIAMQPALFQTPPRTKQLGLFQKGGD